MKRIPAKGVTTPGLDVSHYDETIDFNAVKAAGYVFVSAKATEGTSVVDARYAPNRAKAKAAGLLFGAYHFFRPGLDPAKQAAHFLSVANIQKGDMQPMFDWEATQGSTKTASGRAQLQKEVGFAKIFLNIVEQAIGKKMIIYGPPYMLNDFGLGSEFLDYPLWVAHYGTMSPLVPAPWANWSFHQYAEDGSVPGIPAPNEDMDRFNGPAANVLKFIV